MAGGNKKEIQGKFPEHVVLSVRQVTGKFTPRIPTFSGEENIYSSHGPNCIDLNAGVYIKKKEFFDEVFWKNTVEIRNPGRKRIEIVTNSIGGQIISPFPNYYDINFKEDLYGIPWLHINDDISVRRDDGGRVTLSSNKINTRCKLMIYDNETSTNPIACARLDFVSEKKAEKIFSDQRKHQKHMQNFLKNKGWIETK